MNDSSRVSVSRIDADDPVELPGRLVGAVVEDPRHVQEHRQHHEVRGPSVHVPHEQAEGDRGLQRVDVVPRLRRGRPVEEHQEDAGDREQDEEEEAKPAEAERVAHLHRVALHLHRVQVVQHGVHDHVGPVPGAVGVALPEDRAGPEDRVPGLGALDLVGELLRACRRCARRCPCRPSCLPTVPLPIRAACRRRSRGCWCAGGGRRRGSGSPTLPRMMTPVGQRSTQSAQRVQTSSSIMKTTWSLGSTPGLLGADRPRRSRRWRPCGCTSTGRCRRSPRT